MASFKGYKNSCFKLANKGMNVFQILDRKKEEISPKISSLELDHYPIHNVIIIVIIKI